MTRSRLRLVSVSLSPRSRRGRSGTARFRRAVFIFCLKPLDIIRPDSWGLMGRSPRVPPLATCVCVCVVWRCGVVLGGKHLLLGSTYVLLVSPIYPPRSHTSLGRGWRYQCARVASYRTLLHGWVRVRAPPQDGRPAPNVLAQLRFLVPILLTTSLSAALSLHVLYHRDRDLVVLGQCRWR